MYFIIITSNDFLIAGHIQLNADISSITVTGYDVTVTATDSAGNAGDAKILSIIFSGKLRETSPYNFFFYLYCCFFSSGTVLKPRFPSNFHETLSNFFFLSFCLFYWKLTTAVNCILAVVRTGIIFVWLV